MIGILYMFFWVFPRRQILVGRRFVTLCQFHLEDGTDTGLRNVGQLQFDAGEIPKITYTIGYNCYDTASVSTHCGILLKTCDSIRPLGPQSNLGVHEKMEGVIFTGQRWTVSRYCGSHGTGVLCRDVLHRHRDVAEGGK